MEKGFRFDKEPVLLIRDLVFLFRIRGLSQVPCDACMQIIVKNICVIWIVSKEK